MVKDILAPLGNIAKKVHFDHASGKVFKRYEKSKNITIKTLLDLINDKLDESVQQMSDTLLAEVEVNLLQLAILLGCDDIAEDMLQMAKEHIKSVVSIPVSKSTKEEWVRSILEFIRVRDTIFHKFLNSKILIRNQKEVLTLKQR